MKTITFNVENKTTLSIKLDYLIKTESHPNNVEIPQLIKELDPYSCTPLTCDLTPIITPALIIVRIMVALSDDIEPVPLYYCIQLARDAAGGMKKSYCLGTSTGFSFPHQRWSRKKKYSCLWTLGDNSFWVRLERRNWRHISICISHINEAPESISSFFNSLATLLPERISQINQKLQSLEYVFENERKNHCLGRPIYSKSALFPWDRGCWTNEDGKSVPYLEMCTVHSGSYRWSTAWSPLISNNITDNDGWMYSSSWGGQWVPYKSFGKCVRRRLWFRKYTCDTVDEEKAFRDRTLRANTCGNTGVENLLEISGSPESFTIDSAKDLEVLVDFDVLRTLIYDILSQIGKRYPSDSYLPKLIELRRARSQDATRLK